VFGKKSELKLVSHIAVSEAPVTELLPHKILPSFNLPSIFFVFFFFFSSAKNTCETAQSSTIVQYKRLQLRRVLPHLPESSTHLRPSRQSMLQVQASLGISSVRKRPSFQGLSIPDYSNAKGAINDK
jgi:hypothetical protein